MKRPIIGITMGDPAGIGAEIIVKALSNKEIYERSKPVVIGSRIVMKGALSFILSDLKLNIIKNSEEIKGEFGSIDLIDLNNITLDEFDYGKVNAKAGQASLEYIYKGIDLAMEGLVNAVVTGPIHKEAIQAAGSPYPGHTEIFAIRTKTKDYAMMLADKNMFLLFVIIFCLFLGTFIGGTSAAIILIAPVFIPVAKQFGIDIIHIGITIISTLAIGLFTPPVGTTLMISSHIGKITMEQGFKGCIPFLIVMVILILIFAYFPIIVMFLPNYLLR